MINKQNGFASFELLAFMLIAAGVIGWIMNIVTITGSSFSEIAGLLVLRIVGIFVAPLGSVLGFI